MYIYTHTYKHTPKQVIAKRVHSVVYFVQVLIIIVLSIHVEVYNIRRGVLRVRVIDKVYSTNRNIPRLLLYGVGDRLLRLRQSLCTL